MNKFAELGLQENIVKAIGELGFEKPTPIQEQCIPVLLDSHQDVLATAQTGTGKTAAFGLPTLQKVDTSNPRPQVLILSPTRELALQIAKDLANYSKYMEKVGVVAVYGGAAISTQIRQLSKNAQIVVATPGRCKDLIKRKKLHLNMIRTVILDEADEMLTMGFKEDLNAILSGIPEERQSLLFSATMSKEVLKISKKYMDDPIQIAVAKMNQGASNVRHIYHSVSARHKYAVLKRIADMNPDIYGIVFCRTRRDTNDIARKLIADGYNADVLNGDLSQAQRDHVMNRFRSRHLQLLVATDVAARGLDVNDLTHVIHYSLPDDDEVYIHRSGRTGRAGKSGLSVAIAHSRANRKIQDIERKANVKFTKEPVPTGQEICGKQLFAAIEKIEQTKVDEDQIRPFLDDAYKHMEHLSREDLIKRMLSVEFNRFLDYYKDAPDLNSAEANKGGRDRDRGDRRERGERGGRNDRRRKGRDRDGGRSDRPERRSRRDGDFTRLFFNLGSKHNANPARLIGMVNEALDSGDAAIGKIDVLKTFSFVEVESSVASDVVSSLHGSQQGSVKLQVEVSASDYNEGAVKRKKSERSENRKSRRIGKRRSDGKKRSSGKDKGRRGRRR